MRLKKEEQSHEILERKKNSMVPLGISLVLRDKHKVGSKFSVENPVRIFR